MFHVSLIEPAPTSARMAKIDVEPDEEYKVEEVLGHKEENRRRI